VQQGSAVIQVYRGAQDPRAVGEARRFVFRAVEAEGCERHASTAVLLTSELATNAVLHGDSGFALRVAGTDDGLRVEIDDDSGGVPVGTANDLEAEGGRVLMIVAAMSRRWGVDLRDGAGKTVWFEL
jgi:serine/threonine-protein kinase RsbW